MKLLMFMFMVLVWYWKKSTVTQQHKTLLACNQNHSLSLNLNNVLQAGLGMWNPPLLCLWCQCSRQTEHLLHPTKKFCNYIFHKAHVATQTGGCSVCYVEHISASLPSSLLTRLNLHDLAYAVSWRGNMALICFCLFVHPDSWSPACPHVCLSLLWKK